MPIYNYPNYQNPYAFLQQSYTPQPVMQPTPPAQTQQAQRNGIKWVQGIEGAKAEFVAPGASDLFMDSEEQQFFIKTMDPSGMPLPLRTFRYEEVVDVKHGGDKSVYVTHEELEARLKALQEKKETDDE